MSYRKPNTGNSMKKDQSIWSWQEHLFIWGMLLFTMTALLYIFLVGDPPEYKTLSTKELEQFITQYLNSDTDGHILSVDEALDIPIGNTIQIDSISTIDNTPMKAIYPGDNAVIKISFPEDYDIDDLKGTEVLFSIEINAIYLTGKNRDKPVLDGTHMDHMMVNPEDVSENE